MTRRCRPVVLAAAVLPAACVESRPPRPPVRVAVYAAPPSLDPHFEDEFLTSGILANVFEGLTALDAALRVTPALAVSWDTPGPTTWRFRLRPGVRFQDGRRVDAADVLWSLDRARRHPRSGVAHYVADVVAVRAPATDLVEIRTQASTSLLLNRLAFVAIVPWGSPEQIRAPALVFPYDVYVLRRDVAWTPRLDGRVLAAELAREPPGRP